MSGFRKTAVPAVLLSSAACFLLFLYAPIEEYITNIAEFSYDLYDLLKMMLPVFLIGLAVLILLFLILRKIRFGFFFAMLLCLFTAFLVTYIQGTFLASVLPPLDGRAIDWQIYERQRIATLAVWAAVISLVLILLRLLGKEKMLRLISCCSSFALCFLILSALLLCISNHGFDNKDDYVVTEDSLFSYSKDQNFIVLVLDAVDSDTLYRQIEQDPDTAKTFEDFTFFRNTVGAYPYTTHCIPYMLSGIWFENEEYTFQYLDRAYRSSFFLQELEKRGYQLGIYDVEVPLTENSMQRFENIRKIDKNVFKIPRDFYVLQVKLVGLKYFPYDLKKYCTFTSYYAYNATKKVLNRDNIFTESNLTFYRETLEGNIDPGNDKCFRFIHVEGAHVPFQYDANMNVVEDSDYESSVSACVTLADAYLQLLKENDVYDNSVILICADHGYNGIYTYGRQNPILLIKGFHERHPLHDSMAPISFSDLQDAYIRLMDGAQSDEIFPWKEGDARERRYLYYYYEEEDTITEYIQTGDADDLDTMVETGNIYTHARR